MTTAASPEPAPLKERDRLPAGRTRAESLRRKLEADILDGRYTPGEKLDEVALSVRFRLSRTPVREALKALSATGLVEIRPHQGVYVARPTLKSVIEMFEVMAFYETGCAELAARRHSAEDRVRMEKALADCESERSLADPSRFYAANVRFHEAIHRAAANDFLFERLQALRARLEPFRRHIAYHPGLIAKSNREHRVLLDAIFSMDAIRAAQAMRAHTAALREDIVALIETSRLDG